MVEGRRFEVEDGCRVPKVRNCKLLVVGGDLLLLIKDTRLQDKIEGCELKFWYCYCSLSDFCPRKLQYTSENETLFLHMQPDIVVHTTEYCNTSLILGITFISDSNSLLKFTRKNYF